MYPELKNKSYKLSVIGLGYVGLPIALTFAKKISVIGFDINARRIDLMKNKIDPSGELTTDDFINADILFTHNTDDLKKAKFFIVTVPTPVDQHNYPDLTALKKACRIVGESLKKGDYVVFESTVYPGCTEEDCVPILEKYSNLKFISDFKVGYSPERINPGDKEHTLSKVIKIVSGCDERSLNEISKVYQLIVTAGIHRAPSIKVAEAAKVIENTQRDINIALMNELSIIFNKLHINTTDVLEAAGTKWNFLKFQPGLVGGHCIGVDPYYLTHKASEVGFHSKVILAGRYVNDSMGGYVAKQTALKMISKGMLIKKARVLVMGVTFKENVEDIRNSKVLDITKGLKAYKISVEMIDPRANHDLFRHEYGEKLSTNLKGKYDVIIVAVSHKEYLGLTEKYFISKLTKKGFIVDLKGIYGKNFKKIECWSL